MERFNYNIEMYQDHGMSGLQNLGNTCFMNSVIQCLSKTLPLTNYFMTEQYLEDKNQKKEAEVVNEYLRLLKGMYDNNCTIAPVSFKNKLGDFVDRFIGYRQHDAQEFMTFLLDLLHDGLSQKVKITISGKCVNVIDKMAVQAARSWRLFFKDNYSIIVELFYGQFLSKITCKNCKKHSSTYDPFCHIQLEIPKNKEKVDIYDCLNSYSDKEILDDDNKWKCDKCNTFSNASKKIMFWSMPNILIISFKRFTNNNQKINNFVDYPIDGLNLQNYVVGYDRNESIYDLYAVVNHIGNVNGGHYFSFCKNGNKNWLLYNDSKVLECPLEKIKSNMSYILMYKKRK